MRILLGPSVSLLLLLAGGDSSADGLVRDTIKAMNDLADAYEAGAPDAKVKDLQAALDEAGKKFAALKLSDDDKKQLADKYKEPLEKTGQRLAKAVLFRGMKDIGGPPAGVDALVQELIKEMNDLASAAENNAPDSKMKELQAKMDQTGKKLDALQLSDDDKKKLQEKYQEPLQKAAERMLKAMLAKGVPDLKDIPAPVAVRPDADRLMQDMIKAMNGLAEAYEANAPDAKIKELQKNLDDADKKLDDVKLSNDETKVLADKFKDDLLKATLRLNKAARSRG